VYNFLQLPVVASRSPLWEEKELPVVTGLALDRREVLVTGALDGAPSHREEVPGPSPWPFVASITMSVGLIGSVFNVWWLPAGLDRRDDQPRRAPRLGDTRGGARSRRAAARFAHVPLDARREPNLRNDVSHLPDLRVQGAPLHVE